jgi:TatD DNase family protein
MTPNLFDIHCHLYDLPDLDDCIARARDAGVQGVLCVSEDLESMHKTLDLNAKHPDFIHAGFGLHPVDAMRLSAGEIGRALEFMDAHLQDARMVGEIGLDFKHAETIQEREKQAGVLRDQLALAARHRLGVNLHSRRALRETLDAAAAFHHDTGLPALLHWFTHSSKLIRKAAAEGLFISAGPAILHSEETLKTALAVPLENLVLETDTPVPFNGVSARPQWVADVARRLAEARRIPLEDLGAAVRENSMRLLSLNP